MHAEIVFLHVVRQIEDIIIMLGYIKIYFFMFKQGACDLWQLVLFLVAWQGAETLN